MLPMRTFVRHGPDVIEVKDTILVGRSSRCAVVLDDDLSSREHCRIELDADRLVVRDLGSRNGVLVNGRRVDGELELHHGDTLSVGRSLLVVLRQHEAPRSGRATRARTRPQGGADPEELAALTVPFVQAARDAMRRGDLDGAMSNARGLFDAHHEIGGGRLDAVTIAEAIDLALDLAGRTADAYWLEQLLDLHLAERLPMSDVVASRLARLARLAGALGTSLDDYVAAAERIEGISRESLSTLRSILP